MATRPSLHKRTISHDSSSSTSSGHRLILEHILSYPGSYELPLRTMYTLNLTPRAQPLPPTPRNGSVSSKHSPSSSASSKVDSPAQQLTNSLMTEMAQMTGHQNSLPPSFVTTFVRKCFASELRLVDFPQGLTGLDYLKDLEIRRRREMKAALERLDINPDNLNTAEDNLAERYPGVLDWYRSLEDKEHKVQAMYTQLYVALRRWILLNELMLTPFSKHSCLAMLNTLYPPVVSCQPTPQLTAVVLKTQRDGFFRYIKAVEAKGTTILTPLIEKGKRQGEETGWPAVRETLDKYLLAANSMIDECAEVVHIQEAARSGSVYKRGGRQVDSGISFTDSRKSSNASSSSDRSLPEQPRQLKHYKSSSTLEKIARELKHIARSKTDVDEIIPQAAIATGPKSTFDAPSRPNVLRKMKSFGGSSRSGSLTSSRAPSETPAFNVDEMRRQRLVYESKNASMAVAH